jgi:hypothetical protein
MMWDAIWWHVNWAKEGSSKINSQLADASTLFVEDKQCIITILKALQVYNQNYVLNWIIVKQTCYTIRYIMTFINFQYKSCKTYSLGIWCIENRDTITK